MLDNDINNGIHYYAYKLADAVDYKLISICHKGDIVVSQDYGVAAMALGKGAYAIHQSGKWHTNNNIDQMLMERHLNKKARRSSHKNHIKGPKKRTEEDDVRFARSFEKMLMMVQEKFQKNTKTMETGKRGRCQCCLSSRLRYQRADRGKS